MTEKLHNLMAINESLQYFFLETRPLDHLNFVLEQTTWKPQTILKYLSHIINSENVMKLITFIT